MTTPVARQRILEARRAALRSRLIGDGMMRELAEAWIDHWDRDTPAERDIPQYWEAAYGWISAQVAGGRKPGDGREPVRS